MTWIRHLTIWHPYLLGVFPILFLYARNVTEMRLREVLLPFLLVLAVVIVALAVLSLIIRDRFKAGLFVSLGLTLFFAYGAVLDQVSDANYFLSDDALRPEWLVLPGLLILLAGVSFLLLRSRRDLSRVSHLLSQVALVLVLIQIGMAGYAWSGRGEAIAHDPSQEMSFLEAEYTPDIYLIVLDAYARSDVLREIYDYDNGEFIAALEARGFYVADSATSNYNSTAQSLTSMLNLNYLHKFMAVDRHQFSRMPTAVMLENNRVVAHLRKYGYRTAAFATGYAPTEIDYADYYFSPGWTLSEFQNHLLNKTPLPFLVGFVRSQFDLHRERITYILEKLPTLDELPSPKFVFAHIDCPHPPFVFGPDGEARQRDWPFSFADGDHYLAGRGTKDEYLTGYRDQVRFISGRILVTIDSILARSPEPPVIILQADHGPGSRLTWERRYQTDMHERFSILNAYYLPGLDDPQVYESISPVNSFRVVLNGYFGAQYEILPDQSFFTTWTRPYNFIEITKEVR